MSGCGVFIVSFVVWIAVEIVERFYCWMRTAPRALSIGGT